MQKRLRHHCRKIGTIADQVIRRGEHSWQEVTDSMSTRDLQTEQLRAVRVRTLGCGGTVETKYHHIGQS